MMGFLSNDALQDFFAGWAEVIAVIERVKAASVGGALIQYPKIPPSVSESLAARILLHERIFETATCVTRGGRADIVVVDGNGTRLVEVKGSGSAEFQTFGPKDYACDLLVWLRFGEVRQLNLRSTVSATLFPKPTEAMGPLGTRVTHGAAEAAAAARGHATRRINLPLAVLLG